MTTDNISDTKLKLPESKLSAENPFQDDVLKRSGFAENLTNLVKDQTEPFTISLHGQWGTGKTFLLERWQKDLANNGIHSIYFNAWADDFCNDPLVAIIGQLSEFLNKEKPKGYKSNLVNLKKFAKPILMKTVAGTISNFTGIDVNAVVNKLSENIMDEYSSQSKSRDELKKCLKEIACQVKEDTDHPLVFIIDELDRCRPLFAIELLERVKHIFEIPNMVFILGINKNELCKSIQSVYGEINADDYLRRFFDMDILLPEANLGDFCDNLMSRCNLNEIYSDIGKNYPSEERSEYANFGNNFSVFCSCLDLSLRDIEHCIRALFFIGKNTDKRIAYPQIIIILIILRIKEKKLYQGFIQDKYSGCEIMDFIYSKMIHKKPDNDSFSTFLNVMEVYLYQISGHRIHNRKNDIISELNLLEKEGNWGTMITVTHLSERTKELNHEGILQIISCLNTNRINREAISMKDQIRYISSLIDNVDMGN